MKFRLNIEILFSNNFKQKKIMKAKLTVANAKSSEIKELMAIAASAGSDNGLSLITFLFRLLSLNLKQFAAVQNRMRLLLLCCSILKLWSS